MRRGRLRGTLESLLSQLAITVLGAWVALAAPDPAPATCSGPASRLGPAEAPLRVVAFLDPLGPGARTTWLELRRLVAEHRGELVVEIELVASGRARIQDHLRAVALVASDAGRLERALWVLDRDGVTRTHVRLHDSAQRPGLAAELGVPEAAVAGAEDDACLLRRLERATDRLQGQLGRFPGSPIFELDGRLFAGSSSLTRLRPELGRLAAMQSQDVRTPRPPLRPVRKGVSASVVRPWPGQGALVGGPGLPHHVLLLARDEDDPNLGLTLGPVLDFRSRHPGALSVQVVARGDNQLTDDLRLRLCAARKLGRELPYLRYLSRERGDRHVLGRDEAQLLTDLDAQSEACADEPPVRLDPSLPAGPWLDGTPRSRGDLDGLAPTLRLLELARPPGSSLLEGDPRRQR